MLCVCVLQKKTCLYCLLILFAENKNNIFCVFLQHKKQTCFFVLQKRKKQVARIDPVDEARTKPNAIDLTDPDIQQQIAQIAKKAEAKREQKGREERVAKYLDSMRREISVFSEEQELDEETESKVIKEVEDSTRAWVAVKNDVKKGEISWFEAKEEYQTIKEETGSVLKELLGEESYDVLKDRLWGDMRK